MADSLEDLSNLQATTSNMKSSTQWYNKEVDSLIKSPAFKSMFKSSSTPEVGKMFMYIYDPKLKDKLPFYDMFPLTIPIDFKYDGFLGLNLHYLPPGGRASLLSALMSIANNDKYDENTKLQISYSTLSKATNRFSGFNVCVKRYLYGHVRSSFSKVEARDWGKVVLLPLQRWSINTNQKLSGSPPY